MQTVWNLKLLYKSDSDPQIKKDLKKTTDICIWFEKKYKNKKFTSSPKLLLESLVDFEKVITLTQGSKPWWYFILKTHLNSEDIKSNALATKYEQIITEASNRVKFFYLDISKIPLKYQKKFLKNSQLKSYQYMLYHIFNMAKFNLSEGEEQLEQILQQTSYRMWVTNQEKVINQQTIKHKGNDIILGTAINTLSDIPDKGRNEVQKKINTVLKSISGGAENELNAICNYKKAMDERRGYKKPYSETILSYQNSEKNIESLVSLISKNFKIAHRFYTLQAKLLHKKTINLADRNVNLGRIKTTFDFKTSIEILRRVFAKFDKQYVDIFDSFLKNGQIDVYPKRGKQTGAYCWGMGKGLPTFVLMNFVNDVNSLQTLAHEMGHAFHGELSKDQPAHYQAHTSSVAEVASTLFEQSVAEEVEKLLSLKEKIILLHDKIKGDISTIFRQIACFNFETELHSKIRKEGQISKEVMAEMMTKHLKSYLGKSVEVSIEDGYFYVYWSHIRRFFYVYTYAYGQIISRGIYENWKKDSSYAKQIEQFLRAGGSKSPEDIFKTMGINTSNTLFFKTGLKAIENDIKRLEKLTENFI